MTIRTKQNPVESLPAAYQDPAPGWDYEKQVIQDVMAEAIGRDYKELDRLQARVDELKQRIQILENHKASLD